MLLNVVMNGPKDGLMIPIPQYPMYSALLTILGGQQVLSFKTQVSSVPFWTHFYLFIVQVPYYLDEERGWSTAMSELVGSLARARSEGITVRGMAVINPGNPTGQV